MKYDIVGSFLLPSHLVSAHSHNIAGIVDSQHLVAIEDDAVRQLVTHQIEAGLTEVTSGEFRRRYWDKDFWFGFDGVRCERVESGHLYQPVDLFTDLMRFSGRITYNPSHPFFRDFMFLHEYVADSVVCRQTIPSPANLYMVILGMTFGNHEQIYPTPSQLFADIAEAYNKTIKHFYEIGCRHVQIDDTVCGLLCDTIYTKRLLQGGVDLIGLHDRLIGLFNDSIADIPADMELSIYLSGGDKIVPEWEFLQYPDNIMPKILSQVNVSKFFMPFDIGDDYQLEVLRNIPDGKKVVLGLSDAHSPFYENPADIRVTMSKAMKFIPRENLSVSPKTGFKLSSYASRGLTYEDQWKKLAHLKNTLCS
jgi:5-methyltetrahydropteroyltriglutamate-homocysteine methyltransferase